MVLAKLGKGGGGRLFKSKSTADDDHHLSAKYETPLLIIKMN